MNKQQIIETLAKSKTIEKLISKYSLTSPYKKDLAQDLYIELLKKDEKLIEKLYSKNEFNFYIMKMIKNNVNSTTSPYYKNYEKFRKTTTEIQNEKAED